MIHPDQVDPDPFTADDRWQPAEPLAWPVKLLVLSVAGALGLAVVLLLVAVAS